MTERLTDIDRAKGFAIFLVVLGHIVAGDLPAGNAWFGYVITVIYSFHMPFFMYLSGFVMMYTYRRLDSAGEYGRYVVGKFNRLAPGFFVFAVIILVGKILTSRFLHVDNMPEGFLEGIQSILLTPGLSAAKSLWFIYVLFEFYLVVPFLLMIFKGRVLPIVAIGAAIHFLPSTHYFMLEGFFEYLIYFSIGALAASAHEQYRVYLDKYRGATLVLFVLSFVLLLTPMSMQIAKLVIGLMSIPAIHALMRGGRFSHSSLLIVWGLFSYAIYLMNTIAIGFVKGLVLYFSSWDGLHFLWVAPLLLISGLYGPILVKSFIFPYLRPLDRITS
ncbi:MAG: acyltransferase family protein [Pseudomonadales bacterium]|nr:acyltransferase family protein [Pseudomonadales bacterium]